MEKDSLMSKQILLPDCSRGFNYPRWKSQIAIDTLKENGLTTQLIQKELKTIHNVASATYNRAEIVCSKLSLQILAGLSLSIAFSSFIIFITMLLICALLKEINETLHEHHQDSLQHYIVSNITIQNVIIICGISSMMTTVFFTLGCYIIYKSYQNKSNQYIEAILAVHEHIYDRLCNKYEQYGIVWKLITHKKDTQRMNMFGANNNITYYGIVVKLADDNDIDHYCGLIDVDEDDISPIPDVESDSYFGNKRGRLKHDKASNSDMLINYYENKCDNHKNRGYNKNSNNLFKKVFNAEQFKSNKNKSNKCDKNCSNDDDGYHTPNILVDDNDASDYKPNMNKGDRNDSLRERLHDNQRFVGILSPTTVDHKSTFDFDAVSSVASSDYKMENVPLFHMNRGRKIGTHIKLTDS